MIETFQLSMTEWIVMILVAVLIATLCMSMVFYQVLGEGGGTVGFYIKVSLGVVAVSLVMFGAIFNFYHTLKYDKWVKDVFVPSIEKYESIEVDNENINNIETDDKMVMVDYIVDGELHQTKLVKRKEDVSARETLGVSVGIVKYTDEVSEPMLTYKQLDEDTDVYYKIDKDKPYHVELHVPKDFK